MPWWLLQESSVGGGHKEWSHLCSASAVARPALVGVYELTPLNTSPKLAHTARSQAQPHTMHVCSGLRNRTAAQAMQERAWVAPAAAGPPAHPPLQDQKAVPQSGWFIEILVKK